MARTFDEGNFALRSRLSQSWGGDGEGATGSGGAVGGAAYGGLVQVDMRASALLNGDSPRIDEINGGCPRLQKILSYRSH
jgi:hypothetical protein